MTLGKNYFQKEGLKGTETVNIQFSGSSTNRGVVKLRWNPLRLKIVTYFISFKIYNNKPYKTHFTFFLCVLLYPRIGILALLEESLLIHCVVQQFNDQQVDLFTKEEQYFLLSRFKIKIDLRYYSVKIEEAC